MKERFKSTKTWLALAVLLGALMTSCNPNPGIGGGENTALGGGGTDERPPPPVEITLISVDAQSDEITIQGDNLDHVSAIRMTGPNGFDHSFSINSKTKTNIIALATSTASFLLNGAYNLILTNAYGQTSYSFSITLDDNSVTGDKLAQSGATNGQVLKWDSVQGKWIPSDDIGAGTGGGTVTQVNLSTGLVGDGTNFTDTGSIQIDTDVTGDPSLTKIPFFNNSNELEVGSTAKLKFSETTNTFSIFNDGSLKIQNQTPTDIFTLDSSGIVTITGKLVIDGALEGATNVCQTDGTNCPSIGSPSNDSVTSLTIIDGEVKEDDIALNAVTETKILDGSVTWSKIGDSAVITQKINDDAVTYDKLQNITEGSILQGGPLGAPTELDAGTSGNILVGDGTDLASVAVGGDVTMTSGGVVSIETGKVTSDDILDGSIVEDDLADNSITSAKITDDSIVNADVSSTAAIDYSKLNIANDDLVIAQTQGLQTELDSKLPLSGGTLTGDLTIDTQVKLKDGNSNNYVTIKASDNVTDYELVLPDSLGANGEALIINSLGKLEWGEASGPPTGAADGALTGFYPNPSLKTPAVDNAHIFNSAVTSEKISDGTIATADIANDAVTYDKLQNITVGSILQGGTSGAPTELAAGTSGNILVGDGTDLASVAVRGDATLASDGTLTLSTGAFSYNELAPFASGSVIVGNSPLAPTLVDLTASDGSILIGNSSGSAAAYPLTGDVTMTNAGDVTISSGVVDSGKIADGTIVDADVSASAAIAGTKLANTPANDIAATTVQGAINELDLEKQPLDSDLTAIAALTPTDSNIIVGNGTAWVAETADTARTSLGLGTGDSPTFVTGTMSTSLRLKDSDTDNYVSLDASANVTDYTFTFPDTAGTPNYLLQTDGSGNTTWVDPGTIGGVTSVIAGDGLAGTSTTGDVTLSVNVDGSTIETNADILRVPTGGITTTQISDGTIATADIANDAVTYDKLQNINEGSILQGGTSGAPTELAAGTSGNILVGDGTDLASVAVSGDVTMTSAGEVTINSGAVDSGKIADGTIVDADVNSSAAIAGTKLANTPAGDIAATTVQGAINELDSEKLALAGGTMSGAINMGTQDITNAGAITGSSVTTSNGGAITLQDDGTNTGEIRFEELDANGSNYVALKAADDVGSSSIVYTLPASVPNSSGDALVSTTGGVMSWSPMLNATLSDGTIYIGSGTNIATERTMSGDVTMSNAGVVTIANSAVETIMIADDAVSLDKMAGLSSGTFILGDASNNPAAVSMSGQATMSDTGSVTLDNDSVIAKTLTGYTAASSDITSADSILGAIQKIDGNVDSLNSSMGTSQGAINLGTFTGSTITDDSSVKTALQELETKAETNTTNITSNDTDIASNVSDIADIRTMTGTADGSTDLGTFSGSTISDNTTVKNALQELESATEAADTNKVAKAGDTMTGNLVLSNESEIRFGDSGSNYLGFKSPASLTGQTTLTLPDGDGPPNYVLATNGAGVLSWISTTSGSVTSVTATAPLLSSGGLTPDISIPQANGSTDGFLDSADWTTFNNKEPALTAGTTAQYYRGDKSWQTLDTSIVPENTNLYFTDARAKTATVADAINDGTTDVAPSQNAVFDALALKENISDLDTLIGNTNGVTNLGPFTGSTITDDSSVKTALQELETKAETNTTNITSNDTDIASNVSDIADIRTMTGTADGSIDLGTFSGSTISDNTTVKNALQELENATEASDSVSGLSDTVIASEASGNILIYDGTDSWDNKALSGDATLSNTGALTIVSGAVAPTELAPFVGGGVIVGQGGVLTPTVVNLGALDASILIGNVTGTATAQQLSGDIGMTNAGVVTISSGAVDSGKIADGTIVDADVSASAAIAYSKLNIAEGDLSIAKTSGLQTAIDGKLSLTGGTMSGALNMGSNLISSVTDPSSAQDAATKNYVDTALAGISADKITEGNTEAEVIDTGSDGHFKVTTESAERLRVIADGKVGIGATLPEQLLDVRGSLAIGNESTAGSLILRSTDATEEVTITVPAIASLTPYILTLPGDDGDSGQVLTTDGSGVLSWSTVSSDSAIDTDGDTQIQVEENNADEDKIRFDTAGAERMIIDENGAIGVGTSVPASTSILDLTSTTKGFLPPRMTTTQRDDITSPADGMMIFNTTDGKMQISNSGAWTDIGAAQGSGVIAFRAWQNSSQTINNGTFTKGNFQGENYDYGSGFDLTNDQYTIPVTGTYNFTCKSRIQGSTGSEFLATLFVDGVEYDRSGDSQSTADFSYSEVNTNGYFTSGQVIDCRFYQSSGASRTTTGFATITSFSGFLTNSTLLNANVLTDADTDTKIQLEENNNEDKIRFDTAGAERAILDSSGFTLSSGVFSGDGSSLTNIGASSITDGSITVNDTSFGSTTSTQEGINIPTASTAPTNDSLGNALSTDDKGQFYFNTTDNKLQVWDGDSWEDIGSGGGSSGSSGIVEGSNYIKIGKTMIAWGTSSLIPGGSFELITFPVAFTEIPVVTVSSKTRNGFICSQGTGGSNDDNTTTTNFRMYVEAGNNNICDWHAIGPWTNSAAAGIIATDLMDADSDTKIQVEESADEDIIRFDSAGSEMATLNNKGLDVNGFVQVGTTTESCTSSMAGATRYNSTDKVMEFCNGTEWIDFASTARKYYSASSQGNTTAIPEADIIKLCDDFDGCKIIIGMYNWDGTGRTASRTTHFYYNSSNRNWRVLASDVAGTNANGSVQHIFIAYSCYFTDATYSGGSGSDSSTNFGILNWTEYTGETCRLTIVD